VCHFAQGFACSQAVLLPFAPRFGLEPAQAARLASGFAGGIGRQGMTCGAVTGAVMVIGLQSGDTCDADRGARDVAVAQVRDLMARFCERHGSTDCRSLLGYDLSSDEQRVAAKEAGVFQTLCPRFVETAARLAEEALGGAH
jgi:C_GCAxxG_C_C family probable redox protein